MNEEIPSVSLMKHIFLFKRILECPESFLKEEIISLSELINLMIHFESAEHGKRLHSEMDQAFRKYYRLYSEGISSGQLKILEGVTKKTTPILSLFADFMGGYTEYFLHFMHKFGNCEFDKMSIRVLNKCVTTYDAIIFTIKSEHEVPFFFVDYIKHHNPEAIRFEIIKEGGEEIELYSLVDHKDAEYIEPSVENDDIRSLWVDRLKLRGVDTSLLLPEINVIDLQQLAEQITPPEKPDPPNLAKKNSEFRRSKVNALNFMLKIIHSGCKCHHAKLAKLTLTQEGEWRTTSDRPLSEAQLKNLSISIVPPERRYRKNQHTGTAAYDPSACKCGLPDHA